MINNSEGAALEKNPFLFKNREVTRLSTNLTWRDVAGAWKVRWGIGRFSYLIEPGLYAVGKPDENSEVLVTANYKLTLDVLRKELSGLDLWILVIDTKGINVWCAAGKGTFGNYELLKVLNKVKLKEVVAHRRLILPQLGAPGIAAHIIQKAGFQVIYGPVRAEDIKGFLAAGLMKTAEMREVRFGFMDRLVLTPMEFIPDLKYALPFLPLLLLFNLGNLGLTLANFVPLFVSLLVGSVAVPLLLPFIPFRAFSLKGALMGSIWSAVFLRFHDAFLVQDSLMVKAAFVCFMLFISSYSALQFTGSSTYTSLSGTTKETVRTMIAGAVLCAAGAVLLIAYRITT
jgi:hypothetical protein